MRVASSNVATPANGGMPKRGAADICISFGEVQEYVCLIMRAKQRWTGIVLVLAVATLASCKKEKAPDPPPVVAQPSAPDTSGRQMVSYATQKIDTVMVEGMPMPVGLQLVQPQSSIPFLT